MKPKLAAPLLALALSSCATSPPAPSKPIQVPPARLSPAPASVMVQRPANYLPRLCEIFSRLSSTQIETCASSPALKP